MWKRIYNWLFVPCKHEPGEWVMQNMGLNKARYCKKCDKCLDRI